MFQGFFRQFISDNVELCQDGEFLESYCFILVAINMFIGDGYGCFIEYVAEAPYDVLLLLLLAKWFMLIHSMLDDTHIIASCLNWWKCVFSGTAHPEK